LLKSKFGQTGAVPESYICHKSSFMANSIADKLKIKPKYCLLTLNAPGDFKKGYKANLPV